MAGAGYEFWLTDDYGRRITDGRGNTILDNVLWFTASRVTNGIGTLQLALPPSFDTSILKTDDMIQVWRAPIGGRLGLWQVYFLRKRRFETDGGQESLILGGVDPNHLLWRRIVAAYSEEPQAKKTNYVDDMMKEIVTESIADGIAPVPTAGTRVWADLSIAPDLSAGPTLTKAFSFDKLITRSGGGVLPTLAEMAKEAGTEVFFNVEMASISPSAINFIFRTYTDQPGMDVSGNVTFDQERANLEDPYWERDSTWEENYIYSCGGGEEIHRTIQQVYLAGRSNLSQWNRCEGSVQAQSQGTDTNAVREAGRAALWDGRPIWRMGGKPLDTQVTRFGIDWHWGDRVHVRYRKAEFDAIIRTVIITVNSDGEETINARMDNVA